MANTATMLAHIKRDSRNGLPDAVDEEQKVLKRLCGQSDIGKRIVQDSTNNQKAAVEKYHRDMDDAQVDPKPSLESVLISCARKETKEDQTRAEAKLARYATETSVVLACTLSLLEKATEEQRSLKEKIMNLEDELAAEKKKSYAPNIQSPLQKKARSWIDDLAEEDRCSIADFIAQAHSHYGTVGDETVKDVMTKFQITKEQALEAIQWPQRLQPPQATFESEPSSGSLAFEMPPQEVVERMSFAEQLELALKVSQSTQANGAMPMDDTRSLSSSDTFAALRSGDAPQHALAAAGGDDSTEHNTTPTRKRARIE